MNFILEVFAYLLLILSRSLFSNTEFILPKPDINFHVVNSSEVIPWPDKPNVNKPVAPSGFTVTRMADGFNNSRNIIETPDGQYIVAESKGGKVTLLEDTNKDGYYETKKVLLEKMQKPFGMLVLKNNFYLATEDALWKYPYSKDMRQFKAAGGKKILELPHGGDHWTRNLIADKTGNKIFITVGSSSNIGENGMDVEKNRAVILQTDTEGKDVKIYAGGLRNPVGLGFAPGTQNLWTTVNERDLLGEDLVPDYLTSVKENGFYGWPYSYFGDHLDPRIKIQDQKPDLVKNASVPDFKLMAHSASLGLAFYTQRSFPPKYHDGAFIAQHGSWNRKELAGYKVIFVPFKSGKPSGAQEDFLTGFIANEKNSEVYGRPVSVTVTNEGSLLVVDDGSNIIWKVSYKK
jgi:glucose/arabinose dehydrogenase